MSFWTSKRDDANQQIFDQLNKLNNVGDVNNMFGVTPITAGSVDQSFNPARGNLATRQAQANAAAASRMRGTNATPQGDFGRVTSEFAPAWGDLEGKAANAEIQMPLQQQEFSAGLFDKTLQQKSETAQNLDDSSTFNDIFSGVSNLAKIPAAGGGSWFLDLFSKKKQPTQ
jgi:hypothetical protein